MTAVVSLHARPPSVLPSLSTLALQGFDLNTIYHFVSTTGGTGTIGIESVDDPGQGGMCLESNQNARFSVVLKPQPDCQAVCCNTTVNACFLRLDGSPACTIRDYVVRPLGSKNVGAGWGSVGVEEGLGRFSECGFETVPDDRQDTGLFLSMCHFSFGAVRV